MGENIPYRDSLSNYFCANLRLALLIVASMLTLVTDEDVLLIDFGLTRYCLLHGLINSSVENLFVHH